MTQSIRLALDARKMTDFGIGTYVHHLLAGLTEEEEISLTALIRPGQEERASTLAPSARVIPVAAEEYSWKELYRLPAALSGENFDLVHFPHYVVPWGLRQPFVATVHDVIQLFYPPRNRRHQATLYLRIMMSSTLRRARRVITVSRSSRRDLVRIFGADRKKLRVVHNGVDPKLEERPPSEFLDELKTRFDLRPPLILVVGNNKPHKNLPTALRSFHLAIRKRGIPGQLVFVGGIDASSRLAAQARGLGLGERCRFLGRVSGPELHGLYHLSALLLHIALYEGFGLPILEAMLAGLPVITSNLGAMIELGEGIARLVNPMDVQEISDRISTVLVDDPLRRRMIESGRKFARTLSWRRCITDTVKVYQDVLSGPETGTVGD